MSCFLEMNKVGKGNLKKSDCSIGLNLAMI